MATRNIDIANEEMVGRLSKAVKALEALSKIQSTPDGQERLENKAEGVAAILKAQKERFQNMRDERDVLTLAAIIETGADPKHEEAAKLVRSYLMDYI